MAGYDFQLKPIERSGRVPIMTSQLDRNMGIPSKAESSDQPPERKLSYEIVEKVPFAEKSFLMIYL